MFWFIFPLMEYHNVGRPFIVTDCLIIYIIIVSSSSLSSPWTDYYRSDARRINKLAVPDNRSHVPLDWIVATAWRAVADLLTTDGWCLNSKSEPMKDYLDLIVGALPLDLKILSSVYKYWTSPIRLSPNRHCNFVCSSYSASGDRHQLLWNENNHSPA